MTDHENADPYFPTRDDMSEDLGALLRRAARVRANPLHPDGAGLLRDLSDAITALRAELDQTRKEAQKLRNRYVPDAAPFKRAIVERDEARHAVRINAADWLIAIALRQVLGHWQTTERGET